MELSPSWEAASFAATQEIPLERRIFDKIVYEVNISDIPR
jgi:hypothetical protein